MPKRGVIATGLTTLALVLLLNFKTPEQAGSPVSGSNVAIVESAGNTNATEPSRPTTTSSRPLTTSTPTPKPAPTTPPAQTATILGSAVPTQYGTIQVEIKVANGQLRDVVAVQLPSGRRSGRISQIAGPILREEALSARSANIDTVSGATYTSRGYARSLQSALDKAGLA